MLGATTITSCTGTDSNAKQVSAFGSPLWIRPADIQCLSPHQLLGCSPLHLCSYCLVDNQPRWGECIGANGRGNHDPCHGCTDGGHSKDRIQKTNESGCRCPTNLTTMPPFANSDFTNPQPPSVSYQSRPRLCPSPGQSPADRDKQISERPPNTMPV